MATPDDSALGREVEYPRRYDASLLFPIERAPGRSSIGVRDDALPFAGIDRWHAYELGWLDARGKPNVATATIAVPATSPRLVESKSLKLYLNSFNAERFDTRHDVLARIVDDLTASAGAGVDVAFGVPDAAQGDAGESLDALDVDCDRYDAPHADFLGSDVETVVEETLHSALLKSNCPVTGQPDWASVRIAYRGPRIERAGLLRYLVSYRQHAEFHEQCVERMFVDLSERCAPQSLSIEARYTRRGGLDINPWRGSPGLLPPAAGRDLRQ